VDFENHVDTVLIELDDLGIDAGREAALAAVELEDSVDIGAGRRASLISGLILSSLRRLLPSRTMRLMTGFSRTLMTKSPVSVPLMVASANRPVA
jgi:hypothetical protein